ATEGDFKDVPLTQIRKTIARRLAESNGPVPTFFLTAEFDATRAAELRTQLTEMGDQYKVSFNDIVIRAVALALAEHPEVNAHWLNDKIRHFNRILAIGGVEEKPVVIDGTLEVRQRMRVTMSCDHRAVDGATGAKFLQTVRRYIENPLSLII